MDWKAPAKVNLFLQVRGKREDGYHELWTLFVPVSLYDTLRLYPLDSNEFSVTCPSVPEEENLVYRAGNLLLPYARGFRGCRISIEKNIPMGAGLGGGSSDAACALRMLNHYWECQRKEDELHQLALSLGSDVPFFLWGKPALGEGRGEILRPIDRLPFSRLVLWVPPLIIPTKAVYGALQRSEWEEKDPRLEAYLKGEGDFPLRNDLFPAASFLYPELQEFARILQETKPSHWGLSGSGSSFWAHYADGEDKKAKELTKWGKVYIVDILGLTPSHSS